MNWTSSLAALHTRLCGALVIVAALTFPALGAGPGKAGDRVALVGKTAIIEQDISYKIQIEKAYRNEGATREAAFVSLVNDAIEHEIAAIHDVAITREEMDSFKRHVDDHTKAPEILQKVKALFADDLISYERLYLAPKIINRKLRYFCARSSEIHENQRSLIEKAYGLVVSGKSFQEAAEQCGLKYASFDTEGKGTELGADIQRIVGKENMVEHSPLISVLETLTAGEIYGKIVEDECSYRVIRLVRRNGGTYTAEAVTVNKRPFDEWLRQEASKIRIGILEQTLRDNVQVEYHHLWWAKTLR